MVPFSIVVEEGPQPSRIAVMKGGLRVRRFVYER
jgi:hypothetical protein